MHPGCAEEESRLRDPERFKGVRECDLHGEMYDARDPHRGLHAQDAEEGRASASVWPGHFPAWVDSAGKPPREYTVLADLLRATADAMGPPWPLQGPAEWAHKGLRYLAGAVADLPVFWQPETAVRTDLELALEAVRYMRGKPVGTNRTYLTARTADPALATLEIAERQMREDSRGLARPRDIATAAAAEVLAAARALISAVQCWGTDADPTTHLQRVVDALERADLLASQLRL